MSYAKRCPECNEMISSNLNKCECGWKNNSFSQAIPDVMIRCANSSCDERGLGKVNRVNEKDFLCNAHWEEFILKNQSNPYFQIQAQRILMERQMITEAKSFGISNYEYFKKKVSGWGGIKNKLIAQHESAQGEKSL